ncbi:uncharacterized protein LOC124445311 [Xenia sp. Carnegie-2017]|uniref:uncharacterized protein LOC124445311 n=1 Tax=Xenia sp. Carnegie-2017 TaxID=2897299 RepID=UPI001F044F8B|nr:uncharacterized protein LOC124445311 [Xenia sp. Carnegie-2017]
MDAIHISLFKARTIIVGQKGVQNAINSLQKVMQSEKQIKDINLNDGCSRISGFPPKGFHRQGRPLSIQVPFHTSSLVENTLLAENARLKGEMQQLQSALTNSKLDTAEMYSKFGEIVNDWIKEVNDLINVVNDLKKMQLEMNNDYEARIKSLEEKTERLIMENEKMKKVIKDFEKMNLEFEKQKRRLKIGQVAYKLERLVSEYVFPGQDKASKRVRFGANLKSLKRKIDSLNDQNVQDHAKSHFSKLNKELFEDWFIGLIQIMKYSGVDITNPNIGTYEEMKAVINEEFGDQVEHDDMLIVLDHLREMYLKMERPFGE